MKGVQARIDALPKEIRDRLREALLATYEAAYRSGCTDAASIADGHDRKDIGDEIRRLPDK